jgi:hypothetical protein
MLYGFSEVSKFAGITFEEFVRKFLKNMKNN